MKALFVGRGFLTVIILMTVSTNSAASHVGLKSATSACKAQLAEAPSATGVAQKNFGGPYNFGVQFQPVTDEVAREFWAAYGKRPSFTSGIRESDTVTGKKFAAIKPETRVVRPLTNAVNSYLAQFSGWIKTMCANPDMNKLLQGKLEFVEPIRKIPREHLEMFDPTEVQMKYQTIGKYWEAVKKDPALNRHLGACAFEKEFGYTSQLGADNPRLDIDLLVGDDWSLIPDANRLKVYETRSPLLRVYAGLSATNRKTGEIWYGTANGQYDEISQFEEGAGRFVGPVGLNFLVADNFLVPDRTVRISKGLTVPVAKFDPKTGKIIAFYDFGLLVLHGFPNDKPVTLTTVITPEKAAAFRNTGDASRFGTRAEPYPLGSYVRLGDFPARTMYWGYDRIPTGSIHFMANAFWNDPLAASSSSALLVQMAREKIIDLYLNNSAWINTYDEILDNTTQRENGTFENLARGQCAPFAPLNIPQGMWISHEIVIGGAAGRRALFEEHKPISILDSCAK